MARASGGPSGWFIGTQRTGDLLVHADDDARVHPSDGLRCPKLTIHAITIVENDKAAVVFGGPSFPPPHWRSSA